MKRTLRALPLTLASSIAALAWFAPGCSGTSKPTSQFETSHPSGEGAADAALPGDDDDASDVDSGTYHGFGQDSGIVPDTGTSNCATATATASREAVYMLFVLDGSYSMVDSNKWQSAVGAIDSIFNDMQTKGDQGLGVGLLVFSDDSDTSNGDGPYPTAPDVPIAFVDSTQLSKLVGRTASPDGPGWGTPTETALTGGYSGELGSYTPTSPLPPHGKSVLVLITDGVPSDCSTNGDGTDDYTKNTCVTKAKAQLAATGAAGSIETFVIGVGDLPGDFSNYDPYFLAALAQAGGTASAGCNAKENTKGATDFCYFNVDPSGSTTATQQGFEAAIDAIRGQLASCTFALGATDAGTIDPTKVNVTVNGQTIPQDATNGWTYDDPNHPTSVTLNGTACNDLKASPNAQVSIVLGCETVLPPPPQ